VTSAPDKGLDVSVRVENTGTVVGDEVPQVYLDAPGQRPDGVQFAVRALAAFDRVTLRPGETKDVTMHVSPRSLEYWSIAETRWIRSGPRQVRVGSSSRDLKLTANAE
jgi:beta-glucosidase